MALLGSTALLQVEIDAGIEVFKLLEPEVQKGFIALFHAFHHKQKQISAAQFLAEAQAELQRAKAAQPAAQATRSAAGDDLSSISLDEANPNATSYP